MTKTSTSKYLGFIEALSQINGKYDLSHREISLLNYVYLSESNNQRLNVKDLLALHQIGSQATLHSSIQRLIQKKLLKVIGSKEDRRNKFIELTGMSRAKYAQIEKAMAKASI